MLSPFEAAAYPRKRVPFYRTLRFLQAAACSLLIAASLAVIPASQTTATTDTDLTNSLADWVMIEEPGSAGSWSQFDATGLTDDALVSPMSSQPILPPPAGAGNLYFVKDQHGPSAGVLYIPLAVPAGSGAISLSFDYFVQTSPELAIGDNMSAAGSLTAWSNQQFRVDIVSAIPEDWFAAPGVPLVALVAPTKGSSNPATAWTSVDVAGLATSLAGSRGNTVYLAFREVDNQSYLTVGVDNVRFAAETVVPVLCDSPTTPAQVFACAISVNPATVSAASVAVGDAPPGMFTGLAPLGEPIIFHPTTLPGYGWSLFSSPTTQTPANSTVPDPVDGSYHLFETGEPGITTGVEGTLSIPFTIPANATMASLTFAYFLQSGSTPLLAAGQEFTLSYTSDTPGYPGSGSLFSASEVTGLDGNPWGWQILDFFDVAELSVANVERDYTLVFSANAGGSTMQVGVDLLQVYSDGRDLTKKTFAVHAEPLLAYPIHGADYGVMSTGDAATVIANASQGAFLSAQFGGTTYTEGASVRDLTRISMDLVPPGGSRCVSLDIRFLSEEFPEYVGSSFNDIFLAELRQNSAGTPNNLGTPWAVDGNNVVTAPDNFAVVPVPPVPPETVGTTTVLSINTTNEGWFSAEAAAGTAFDGSSILLRATKEINVGTTSVELILSLFDQSDESYDTAVMLDALKFWPTVDCSASSETPIASSGIQVVAPAAEWSAVTDAEVFVDELPTLTLVFDQPVTTSDLLDNEILNVGDASGCLFDVTPQNASDGSATTFTVAVTSCGPGDLQPQLVADAAQGLANNAGPEFQVTSFPIKVFALGGGGGGGGGGGSSASPSASVSPSPSASPSASVSPSPSGIALASPTPSASAVATPSPSEAASPDSSPNPGASPGASPESPAPPSVAPTDSPIRDTDKAAVRVKDTAAGTRIYINERTSSSFIAASIPSIQQAISSPGIWFGGLLLSVLLAFAAILLEAPLDWIKRRIKEIYLRVVAYIEPKDRGARLRKIFGIRVDVFPFLVVGQLIAALNAPLDAIPPLHQLLLGCVYGAFAALIIHAVTKWPEIRSQRIEHNDGGEMRPQWLSIVLALGAVAIAQSFGFAPGLIVGIFAMRHFRKDLDERGLAQSSWHLSLMLIAASLISWVGLEWVALLITDPEAPLRVISDMVLGTLVVAGSQGLIWTLLNPAEAGSRALRNRSILRWVLALTAGTTMTIAILMGGGGAQGIFSPNATLEQLRGLIISGVVLFAVLLLLHRFTRYTAALWHRVHELESRLKALETD